MFFEVMYYHGTAPIGYDYSIFAGRDGKQYLISNSCLSGMIPYLEKGRISGYFNAFGELNGKRIIALDHPCSFEEAYRQ